MRRLLASPRDGRLHEGLQLPRLTLSLKLKSPREVARGRLCLRPHGSVSAGRKSSTEDVSSLSFLFPYCPSTPAPKLGAEASLQVVRQLITSPACLPEERPLLADPPGPLRRRDADSC